MVPILIRAIFLMSSMEVFLYTLRLIKGIIGLNYKKN
ncbi:hypothetical protein SAMN05216498_1027 [Tenuibacillus multivorans]|uniref:Uncharacterized protein n=1 Tax=Tenuibacillus multivorans TaxID=237069 RepID=A0A1G9X703_9BACI|nr:hypothetical protein SAMN05216498_1027 [Tenuibacillus multivorans]